MCVDFFKRNCILKIDSTDRIAEPPIIIEKNSNNKQLKIESFPGGF